MYIYRGAIDQQDRWHVYVTGEGIETSPLPFLFQDSHEIMVADRKWHWGDDSAETYWTAMSIMAYEFARDFGTEAAEEFAIPVGTTFATEVMSHYPVLKQRDIFYMNWFVTSEELRHYVALISNTDIYTSYEGYCEEEFMKWYQQKHHLG